MFLFLRNYLPLLMFLCLMFSLNIRSQDAITGTINEQYLGISFTVPDNWQAYEAEIGYLLVSETQKGFILVMQHDYDSIEELRNAARETLADENGTYLQPDGNPEMIGTSGIAMHYAGTVEWQQAKAYALALISPHGGGLTILTAVEPQSFSQKYIDLVHTIGRGVEFTKPEIPPVVEQWRHALTGMRLTYMHTYSSGSSGGFSDKIVIDLCSGGVFGYSDRSSVSVDVGGAFGFSHGQGGGAGAWDIVPVNGQPALQLSFHDGSVHRYFISLEDDKFYLDNRRYFRTHDPACR